jgi:hypothetical protein
LSITISNTGGVSLIIVSMVIPSVSEEPSTALKDELTEGNLHITRAQPCEHLLI